MSVWRLAARSTARVLMRPWMTGLLLLILFMAWDSTDTVSFNAPGGRPVRLQPSVWDALQRLFSGSWELVYVAAVPCAFLGVALTAGARNSGWSALMVPRAGGLRPYTRATLIAGLMVTGSVIVVFGVMAAVVAAVRGASFGGGPEAGGLAALALNSDPMRKYTIVPELGGSGSLALAATTFTLVSFGSMLAGQWIGTVIRRPAVASALAAGLLIFSSRIVGPQIPDGLAERIDPWLSNNLDNYTGFRGSGGISIAWAFVVPLLLIVVFALATWWTTRRRGVAGASE